MDNIAYVKERGEEEEDGVTVTVVKRPEHTPNKTYPILTAALICGVIGCLVMMVSTASPGWLSTVDTPNSYTIGLFALCDDRCRTFTATDVFAVTKGLVLTATFGILVAIINSFVYYCQYVKRDIPNRFLPWAAAICYIAGAWLALQAAIVFAASGGYQIKNNPDNRMDTDFRLNYSFHLCIVGGIVSAVTAVLTIVHKSRCG